jgi:hypothetical protein
MAVMKSQISFPAAWTWLVDEAIPSYVKQHYSPKDSWKTKPFSREDARFFFRGIEELSDLFTVERERGIPAYFLHPKYRSAYLLYFLPLQAAKFVTLFETYPKAIEAALLHSKSGVLRIADLGAGPGTASLSLLVYLLKLQVELPEEIEIHLLDTHAGILKDGKQLIELFANAFPKLREKVKVQTHVGPWWRALNLIPGGEFSLTLMGHVLNESSGPRREQEAFWPSLVRRASGGGILMVEPAARKPAQTLASIRDSIFEAGLLEATAESLWGPCLHAGRCPLSEGRDWCHFSSPILIPGQWFKEFSVGLGSERDWVKFSYLWLASPRFPSSKPYVHARRVISDPLSASPSKSAHHPSPVLLCEPETPKRWIVPGRNKVRRGDIVNLTAQNKLVIPHRPNSVAGAFVQPRIQKKAFRK